MRDKPAPRLATVKEYAEIYRVHEQTVYQWIQQGAVDAIKRGAGRRRIVRILLDDAESAALADARRPS